MTKPTDPTGEQQGEIVTDNNQQAELPPLDADIQERIGRISSLDKTELTNLSEEVLDCRERQLLKALRDLAAEKRKAEIHNDSAVEAWQLSREWMSKHDAKAAALQATLADLAAAREQIAAMKRGPEFYAYTGLISDVRLEGMIDETRWWKTPGDEVYEVVRELKESRSKIARLEGKLELQRQVINENDEKLSRLEAEKALAACECGQDKACRLYDRGFNEALKVAQDYLVRSYGMSGGIVARFQRRTPPQEGDGK